MIHLTRQMVGRILVEMFRAAVNNKIILVVEEVMRNVQLVIDDSDTLVRSDLVEQIPNVALICHEAPHLFGNVLRNHLLGIVIKYLSDSEHQVRQMAQGALMTLVKRELVDIDTIENDICLTLDLMSYVPSDEHLRNSSISLMCRLAPLIGSELTEKIFLRRYLELCEDNDMMVRRICATHFGEMCIAVGKEKLYNKLIPTFVDLCGDKVWSVRKACVEVMMPVSCCSTPEQRLLLAEILAKHLTDGSKWVRISAFQILGPFISTFAKQFADVTYNKHGDLVYTSKQDNHLSICYSYEGIFPKKSAIISQIPDIDDNTKSPFFLPVMNVNNAKVLESSEESDYQKNEVFFYSCNYNFKDCKPMSKEKCKFLSAFKRIMDDTERYNPFLYYYIPPDIPLDDELIHAARQSAMNRNNVKNATETEQESANEESNSSCSSEIPIPIENLGDEKNSNVDQEFVYCRPSSCEILKTESKKNTLKINRELRTDVDKYVEFKNLMHGSGIWNETRDFSQTSNTKINEQVIVPQELITYYVSMADPEQCVDMGTEIPHHCAFSFPAVVLTLGRENWHYLKQAYQSLSSAKHWKVRRTLASSIHEIAMILGEELTATDLVPIYDGFIKDLDEVRIGVLKHLATFLKILKPTDRCQYLPRLSDFLATDNEWNWRFREELATQLLEIVTLFSPSEVAQSIAPLSLQLLVDKVAAVRSIALELITRIMRYLTTEDALVMSLIHELRETLVLNAKRWIHRQTYALVCAHLISNDAITGNKFCKEMLPCLINLSCDRVPNVRLAVARTMAMNVIQMGLDNLGMEAMEEVERILTKMRVDADRDVRVLAGGEEHIDILAYCSSDENQEQPKNILF